jgi:hypothetical protein
MSIVVTPEELGAALDRFTFAYLLTVGDDERPRVVSVGVVLADGTLHITGAGRSARSNIAARPGVTLVWPPADPADMSLILDGEAAVDGESISVPAGRAILHRPAPVPAAPGPAPSCET